ncbi:lipopolysaccharide biosynthesis protein [Oharaeibacter diazotrophicus]|nr:lipopolysaccharide biosynthesis protein [Oharaeibacter diazotrophicus]
MLARLSRMVRPFLPRPLAERVDAALASRSADELSTGGTALSAFALRVAGAGIAYLQQILLARWMGAFDYGVFVVIYVWLTVLGQIGNFGFSSSMIRFVPEFRARGDLARMRGVMLAGRLVAFGGATVIAAAGAAAVLAVPDLVAEPYVIPVVLGAACLPLFCLTEVQDGIARAFAWSSLAFGPTYIWRPLGVMLAMGCAHALAFPMTAPTACAATIVATWATAAIQFAALHRRTAPMVAAHRPAFDLGNWFRVSLPILLSDGFYMMLTSIDVIVVARFAPPEEVAVYYAATKTLALVHFVYYAVRAATGPRFSHHFHAGDHAALAALVRTSVRWAFWPSVAVSIVVLALGEFLLSMFGSDFRGGSGVLTVLVFGLLARASVGPMETLLTMAGHQRVVAAIFGTAFAANLALNLALVPLWGLYGAAAGTALALVLEAVLVIATVRARFGFNPFVFTLARGGETPAAS